MSTQITLGLEGFALEEAPSKARIEIQYYSTSGHKLRGVAIRDGKLTGHDSSCHEHEVGRTVEWNSEGSRHKCNSSCQHAIGKDCECACGGRNHGRARFGNSPRLFA